MSKNAKPSLTEQNAPVPAVQPEATKAQQLLASQVEQISNSVGQLLAQHSQARSNSVELITSLDKINANLNQESERSRASFSALERLLNLLNLELARLNTRSELAEQTVENSQHW